MRNIVELSLSGTTGSAGRVSSFGHVFKKGDVPTGEALTASIDGQAITLQADVKATWEDGSIKHAVLSFVAPTPINNDAILKIATAPAPEEVTPNLSVSDIAADAEYNFEVEVDGEVIQIADLLAEQVPDIWLEGPLTTQARVSTTLENGIDLRVDVTVSADGFIDTSVTLANDNIETVGLESKVYAFAIRQNGVEVLANTALSHPHHTIWRESFSTETSENTTHVVYDLSYLRETGLLPAVDDTLELTDSQIYGNHLSHTDATFDPMELGGVDNVGGVDPDRGHTGTTTSYGVITDDQHSYLVSQTREAKLGMLALTDQYGAFSNYYRNPETGEAYFIEDASFNSNTTGTGKDLAGTGGIIDLENDGLTQRNTPSHKPSEYYLSYLITGDRHYAEGLAAEAGSSRLLWANAEYLTERGAVDFGSQLREQSWMLRDLFYAASLAPDGSHAAATLKARLDGALDDYLDYYVRSGATLTNKAGNTISGDLSGPHFKDGPLEGVLQSYTGTGIDRVYWQDWFGMVIGQIAAGGNDKAKELGEWMAGFSAERFLQDDFDPYHNLYSIVAYPVGSSLDLASDATWADLNAAGEAAGALDSNLWSGGGFYAASAWGGTAAQFNGTRDARYAEALLWMTQAITNEYVEQNMLQGATSQFAIPVTFADGSIAGVTDRIVGTETVDTLTNDTGSSFIHAGAGNDFISTGAGSHLVDGGDGNDILRGEGNENWLFGGSGSDALLAGSGINYLQGDRHDEDFGRFADTFVFDGTVGESRIGDFTVGEDRVALLNIDGMTSIEDFLLVIEQTEDGAHIDLGINGRLLLQGINASELSADDFYISEESNRNPLPGHDGGFDVSSGGSLVIMAADILANDTDEDGNRLTLEWVTRPTKGSVYIGDDGSLHFAATPGSSGISRFEYGVSDGFGGLATAEIAISISEAIWNGPDVPETTSNIAESARMLGTQANDLFMVEGASARSIGRAGDDVVHLIGENSRTSAGNGNDIIFLNNMKHVVRGGGGEDAFVVMRDDLEDSLAERSGTPSRTFLATIVDFNPGEDILYFANGVSGIADFEELQKTMYQRKHNVLIKTEEGKILLRSTDLDDLDASSFVFYNDQPSRPDPTLPPETEEAITGPGWLNGSIENDTIISSEGNIRLWGQAGDDHLIAENWNVRMLGDDGDDLLEGRDLSALMYGGDGADRFYFTNHLDGLIADFEADVDSIIINRSAVSYVTSEDAHAALIDSENGAILAGLDGSELLIQGVSVSDLREDDFHII